ncbi:putative Late nodulin [Medicago truncatula]|uniref:Putative Late nodulin n=1 Tax=Medicago truncatula TaxID=3880 RepID=A0A396H505_MEDTR|nr:putative Late nodulin [Medicago truncatula]
MTQILKFIYTLIIFLSLFLVETNSEKLKKIGAPFKQNCAPSEHRNLKSCKRT